MKSILKVGIASLILAGNVTLAHGPGTHGQPAETPSADAKSASSARQATEATMFAGEIRKVDKAAGKVTLQHDAVPSLKLPKATNVFPVSNPAMLDKVKSGDKVLFTADKMGEVVTVTAIETAR